ncbi:MAG: oligosaccharide flippase family protein [Crocinitomicaceae bacterium]|nr:oligosaccharide flippase family protein [Crocinitomicaceae bacterium]
MGIIQRQALRNSIIQFAGSIIGGISRMLLPIVVPGKAEFGLLGVLDSISGIFVTVFSLGYNTILHQLFPKYRDDERGHHGFFMLGILLSLIGIGISFIIYYFFGHHLLNSDTDLQLFQKFSLLVFPMIFFRILFFNVDGYTKMLYQTYIGTFLDTFLSKILIVAAIIAYAFLWIDFERFVYLYAFTFCVPGLLVLCFAALKTKKITLPSKKLFEPAERKKVREYILFGILIGASGSIVIYIDQLMLTKMISLEMGGVYTLFFFAARFILIPANSILKIAQVILAESWKNNDMKNIGDVYEKSCVNQLLIGAFLLGVGWAVLDPILQLHPKFLEYAPYQNLYLILGTGILIEMATGVNTAVIGTSSIYKYNMYFNLVLAVLVIILNYYFIKEWNLTGAAMASAIAMTIINFARWYLLYRKYGLQPFKLPFVKAFIFSAVFIILCILLRYDMNPYWKILINGTVLTTVFWVFAILFNLSDDVNNWVRKMKTKYF